MRRMEDEEELQTQLEEGEPEEELEGEEEPVAAKSELTVGAPGGRLEREADAVAARVMAMPVAAVQRQELEEEEPEVQAQVEEEEEPIQTQVEEEEEPVQAKGEATPVVTPRLKAELDTTRGSGAPLSRDVRAFMEPRFGRDLSSVRVHTDSKAAENARAIRAKAFTLGNSIWFGHGYYRPHDIQGLHLIGHEVAHTIQQRGYNGSIQTRPTIGNELDDQERTADQAADAVVSGRPIPHIGTSKFTIRRRPLLIIPFLLAPNEKIKTTTDGTIYKIIRYVEDIEENIEEKLKYKPLNTRRGMDKDYVWFEISWCRSTRGKVNIGTDVKRGLRGFANGIQRRINRGMAPGRAVRDAWRSGELTTFVSAFVEKHALAISGGLQVTVAAGGVKGVKGELYGGWEFSPGHEVGVAVGGTSGRDIYITPSYRYTGKKPKKDKCPKIRWERTITKLIIAYKCKRLVPSYVDKRKKPKPITEPPLTRYVYFEYAKPDITSDEPLKKKSKEARDELRKLIETGYRVIKIKGHASPEGPMAATKKGWMGNEELGRQRANATWDYLWEGCKVEPKGKLAMRTPTPPPYCVGPIPGAGDSGVIKGGGELYGQRAVSAEDPKCKKKLKRDKKEPKGVPLIEYAACMFRAELPEDPHRAEVENDLKNAIAGKNYKRMKELVYPRLRRAEITVTKTWVKLETVRVKVPAEWVKAECPPKLLEEAIDEFRIEDGELLKPFVGEWEKKQKIPIVNR